MIATAEPSVLEWVAAGATILSAAGATVAAFAAVYAAVQTRQAARSANDAASAAAESARAMLVTERADAEAVMNAAVGMGALFLARAADSSWATAREGEVRSALDHYLGEFLKRNHSLW